VPGSGTVQGATNNAYRVENTGWSTSSGSYTVGFEFRVNSILSVTHLGVADWYNNGLSTFAPQVGVWDTNGNLLVSVTVPMGAAADLAEVQSNPSVTYYFQALGTPVTLNPGTYVIANQHSQIAGSQVFSWGGSMTWDAAVTWVRGRATSAGTNFAFPNSIFYTAGQAYIGPNFKFTNSTVAGPLTITTPQSRAIFQRNTNNLGTVPITGTCCAGLDRLEYRAVARAGYVGATTDWAVLVNAPGITYSNSATLGSGWYDLQVRVIQGGQSIATNTVARVGVGDNFITAGQSNAANNGSPAQSPTNDLVNALNLNSGLWQVANDPQPYATASGGSAWPAFGDRLAAQTQLPVGVVAVAVGSTAVSQWLPGTGAYYPRVALAINSLRPYGGFRAILWHQGESDSLNGTTAAAYASGLTTIINQSRADAGFNVPWGIALVSWHPSATVPKEAQVLAGHWQVVTNTPGVFKGAETDNYHLLGWLADSVHFNATGLQDHGRQWASAVWYSLLNRTACTNGLGLSNGTATINVRGNPGCTYILQTTTNFGQPWASLSTNVVDTNGLLDLTDPVGSAPQRFYRTAQP